MSRKLKAGEKLVAEITITVLQRKSDDEGVYTQHTDISLREPLFKLSGEEQAATLKAAMKGGAIDVEWFVEGRARKAALAKARADRKLTEPEVAPSPSAIQHCATRCIGDCRGGEGPCPNNTRSGR